MPTSLSSIALRSSSTRLKFCVLFLFISFFANAQTLTGLWTGAVSNDSTTVRKDQSFEIVLTEYKGKVYGYSRNEFIVDDVLYYIVKRVEGAIEGDICEVTDDEIVACNFPKRPEKGVKVTSTFRRNGTDGQWYLDGTWKTNKTKNYYSITGKVSLAEEKDLTASKIFPHLEELKIAGEVAFYKERKEGLPIVKLVKPERDDMASYVNPNFASIDNVAVNTESFSKESFTQLRKENEVRKEEPVIANNSTASEKQEPIAASPQLSAAARNQTQEKTDPNTTTISETQETIAASLPLGAAARNENQPIEESTPEKKIASTYTNTNTDNSLAQNKPGEKLSGSSSVKLEQRVVPETVATSTQTTAAPIQPEPELYVEEMNVDLSKLRQSQTNTRPAVKPVEQKEQTTVSIKQTNSKPVTVSPIPKVTTAPHERGFAAMDVNERRTEVTQVVEFSATTDSVQIALYDNGQIDGDTVSVLMNGEVILSKQGLKATAIKHTIHLSPAVEEFNIVLYAENLGTLPPNTGLVVVRDGKDVYNLRFSSDYQKNTGIVFRRKK